MRSKAMILWGMIALMAQAVQAQEVDFYAEVNKNKVEEGALVRLTFVLENGDINNFNPPPFNDFNVISSSQSSQMSVKIVNGQQQVSRTIKKTFLLRPIGMGEKTIGPATLQTDDQILETDPITIKVVEEVQQQPKATTPGGGDPNYPDDDIFLRAYLNKSEVYEGEQVVATYKLFFRTGINNYNMPATTYNNFWSKSIEIKKPDVKRESINGVQYRTAVIKQDILFPQKSGTLEIPRAEMKVSAQYGFFDNRRKDLKSNSLVLKVKPLPAGAPANFNGAVGNFNLTSSLSTRETSVNEPITLKVKLSGQGNINLAELPKPKLSDDFEVYDPKVADHTSHKGATMSGSKTYEYLIVPRQKGNYKLDSTSFSYFDPEKEAYVTLTTDPYEVVVAGGERQKSNQPSTGLSKEEVELLGEDIRFIKTDPVQLQSGTQYFGSPLFFTMLGLPFVLFVLLLLFRKKKQEAAANPEVIRRKKAATQANKKINEAVKQAADDREFNERVGGALWDYLSDRIGLDRNEQTRGGLRSKLEELQLDLSMANELEAILDQCQMAVYAPGDTSIAREDIAADARKWIDQMENVLKDK